MTGLPFSQDMMRFLCHLGVERQFSPVILLNYQCQLDAIIALVGETGLQSWQQCDAAMVRSLAVRSRCGGLGSVSLVLRLSALRSFLNWPVNQDGLKANPVKSISAPKAPCHPPKDIDADDVNRLLDTDLNDPLAARGRVMLEITYGAGLCLSELVGLDIKHLDFSIDEVWTVDRGSKERRLPTDRSVMARTEHWLDLRGLFGNDDDALFLSKLGKRISARSVQKCSAGWGIEQGLNSYARPHRLRHSFAVHILESSSDLCGMQELSGRASLSMTQIYTRLNLQHLASVYDTAHPRAKRGK